jgi:phage terminase large subunit-like protein
MTTHLEEYRYLIKHREVIVGEWIEKEIDNLYADLQDKQYVYDTREADIRIKFQETLCLQGKAPFYMQPVQLMPWQKAWWEAVYSYKMADTGFRRFTEGLLEIGRKNGKTKIASGAGSYVWRREGGFGARVYCLAPKLDQADLVYDDIWTMTQLDPEWKELKKK